MDPSQTGLQGGGTFAHPLAGIAGVGQRLRIAADVDLDLAQALGDAAGRVVVLVHDLVDAVDPFRQLVQVFVDLVDPVGRTVDVAVEVIGGIRVLAEAVTDLIDGTGLFGHDAGHVLEVGRQLGDYQLVRFDITESNPAQRALLDRYQLFGPPAILLFDAKGDEWLDLRVVGEVDAATFAARLSTARERF